MNKEDLEYQNLMPLLRSFVEKGRSYDRAFINWFLINIYRLDEINADDSICDGIQDKGIDAIYVDDTNYEIHIIQSKVIQSAKKTSGDKVLRELAGTIKQVSTVEALNSLLSGTAHDRLKKQINRQQIKEKLEQGYKVKGIFITNNSHDRNADEYLSMNPSIESYDADRISNCYIDIDSNGGINKTFSFSCYDNVPFAYTAGELAQAYVFTASALELIKLEGIENGELFSQNVRLSLGKTNVNKDIISSIKTVDEHINLIP